MKIAFLALTQASSIAFAGGPPKFASQQIHLVQESGTCPVDIQVKQVFMGRYGEADEYRTTFDVADVLAKGTAAFDLTNTNKFKYIYLGQLRTEFTTCVAKAGFTTDNLLGAFSLANGGLNLTLRAIEPPEGLIRFLNGAAIDADQFQVFIVEQKEPVPQPTPVPTVDPGRGSQPPNTAL